MPFGWSAGYRFLTTGRTHGALMGSEERQMGCLVVRFLDFNAFIIYCSARDSVGSDHEFCR